MLADENVRERVSPALKKLKGPWRVSWQRRNGVVTLAVLPARS